MSRDVVQMLIVLTALVVLAWPVGRYMYRVFTFQRTFLDPVLDPIDNGIYRISGVRKDEQMRWNGYVKAMLLVNFVMFVIIFAILKLQTVLPMNPDKQPTVDWWLTFNTAASFITNTNWQNYGGENTLSYFSQLFAIIFPMFTSAATGLACGVAFIRGIGGREEMGNFYVDLTRSITRLLLPAALVLGFVMVGLGLPATFSGAKTVSTLNGPLAPPAATPDAGTSAIANTGDTGGPANALVQESPTPEAAATPPSDTSQGQQVISRGPVAPLETIKELGTNGGGFFNVNSAHPFENPSPLTNVLEILMMGTIPIAIIFMMGAMLKRMKMALVFAAIMGIMLIAFLGFTYGAEKYGNPLLNDQGLNSAQGNMEGKEQRFGQAQTAIFVTSTTAFTTGAVDSMHESLTPLGSVTPFTQMFLQMVYGGKGVGFITFIVFVIITIFLTGLMVGRTPHFLGKKVEAHEMRLASFAFLLHPALILIPVAMTFGLSLDLKSIANSGPHGFIEVLYAYTSTSANNGSAFAGLTGNTNWFNASLGVVMILGRYLPIVLMLALAGSLAAKKPVPESVGTLRIDSPLFAAVLTGTILVVIVLTFFPVLAIGPIYEHFSMMARSTF